MDEILLRPLELVDIDDQYCAWFENKDGHLDYFSGSGRVFTPESLQNDYKNGLKSEQSFNYLIVTDSGEKIGNIKIGPIDLKNKTSDLVCLIGNKKYLGKGLSVKAIKLANQIAFEKYNIRRLHSGMAANNIASIKAYTRAGWFIEATFQGYYLINGIQQDRICVACLNPKHFK